MSVALALDLDAVSSVCRGWEGVNRPTRAPLPAAPWFDAVMHLGRRGHRYMTEAARLSLAASRQIAAEDGPGIPGGTEAGLYLGTASADTAYRRQVMTGLCEDETQLPGAASAPGASANGPAGLLARSYGVQGPVMTLTGGDDSGLIALWQAASAMARAEVLACLVGQVEAGDTGQHDDGAVLWRLSAPGERSGGTNPLARIAFDGFTRDPRDDETWFSDRFGVPRQDDEPQEPVKLIAHGSPQLADLVKTVNRGRQHPITFLSAQQHCDALAPDMHLFSLLSLAILNGVTGRIIVRSRRGHVFNLNVAN